MSKLVFMDLFIYQRRNLIILPFFSIFFVMLIGDSAKAGLMVAVLISSLLGFTMMANTAFAYDEALKFNKFLRAMPVTPATIVLSRYAACLLSAAAGAIFAMLFAAVVTLFISAKNSAAAYATLQSGMSLGVGIFANLVIVVAVYCSVLMPILFKFGYMKTKYPLILLCTALGAGGPMLVSNLPHSQALGHMFAFTDTPVGYIFLIVISLLAVYASVRASISIFERKEE